MPRTATPLEDLVAVGAEHSGAALHYRALETLYASAPVNALFFKNAGTGRHNMVYRREDGSIGWVEPRPA